MLMVVGGEYEYEIINDIAVLYQQASTCFRQGFLIF
jgi:hypothetical protein